ncbi:conserved hypothetical protein [Acidianus hospitalis W1]|uniref:Uncharacterized protein n=1 Tax=Acidianus hospitalis (strain W1) TaxID=933801 RepID=F4B5M1_ACIHW|nr:hypothetical protein [Acidianus hospitalis]AEE94445.1 conserved hypothetical protein [Acidianus hospitalis W1]
MTRINKKVLLTLVFLSALIPVVAADVIYYYQGSVKVCKTAMPIELQVGPNGDQTGYITTTVGNAPRGYCFTATIYITNSTYDYFYHFLTIKACKPGNLFVTDVSTSTGTNIKCAWLIIQCASNGNTIGEFKIISTNAANQCTTTISLTSGNSYCVSLLVEPNNPLPNSGTCLGTITVYLGYNVVNGGGAISLPPTL